MDLLKAVIYGVVEGLTEFLPISSTGHLILTSTLVDPASVGKTEDPFLTSFFIIIQFGAILSVVAYYGQSLLVDRRILLRVLVAFIPTGIIGVTLYQLIKEILVGPMRNSIVLWSLGLGGVVIVLFELLHGDRGVSEETPDEELVRLPYWKCVMIGLAQSVAMIPGVSRSAATVLGGLALGVRRQSIVMFSFLLAVPTMAAATGMETYHLIRDVSKQHGSFALSSEQFLFLAVGFAVSFVIALLTIRGLLGFVKTNSFLGFGVYRILAALAFFAVVLPH